METFELLAKSERTGVGVLFVPVLFDAVCDPPSVGQADAVTEWHGAVSAQLLGKNSSSLFQTDTSFSYYQHTKQHTN